MALTDRASLLREYYRLLNTSATDDALIEHDSGTLEGAYLDLQAGYEEAQLFLIELGLEQQWLKTGTVSVTGTDPDRYTDTAADFMRLDGDKQTSALWYGDSVRWGTLIDSRDRRKRRGNVYYLRGNETTKEGLTRIFFGSGASIPTTLYYDYIYRVGTLADSTTVDFPVSDRPLIAAFAAVRAKVHDWYTGDQQDEARLLADLRDKKESAARRARQTRQPKMANVRDAVGGRWIL